MTNYAPAIDERAAASDDRLRELLADGWHIDSVGP